MNEDIIEGYRLSKLPHIRQVTSSYFSASRLSNGNDEEATPKTHSTACETKEESEFLNLNLASKKMGSLTLSEQSTSTTASSSSTSSCSNNKNKSDPSLNTILNGVVGDEKNNSRKGEANNKQSSHNNAETSYSHLHRGATALNNSLNKFIYQPLLTSSHKLKIKIANSSEEETSNANYAANIKSKIKSKPAHMSLSKSFSSPLSAFFSTSKQSQPQATLTSTRNTNNLASTWSTSQFNSNITSKKKLSSSASVEANVHNMGRVAKETGLFFKGYLYKFNEKSKKWKPYWFTLNQSDKQLFYFSNEKRVKEKGLIDLNYSLYYPVDDSFFNRPFCFQIIIHSLGDGRRASNNSNSTSNYFSNSSIVHFLCALNSQSFKVKSFVY